MPDGAAVPAQADAPGDPTQPERAPDRFPIYAFDISGVTRLTAAEVEKIVYRFTGPDRTTLDVESARKALEQAYIAKGYESVLVESPLQQRELFSAGVVTLAVNESPIAKVQVVGSRFHSEEVVRRQFPAVTEGEPLDFKALQTQFSDASRFPDREVEFSPKPGEVPGTIDVDLVVKDRFPVHGSLELNNDNSASTSRLRLNASVRYTDLWRLGHTLSGTYVVAPERRSDSDVIAASYVAPLLGTPWTLTLSGYRSNSNIAALGGTNVLGNGFQVGLRAAYRLPGNKLFQSFGIGADYKHFDQDVTLAGVSVGATPIRYLPVTVDYRLSLADSESGFAKTIGTSTLGLTLGATMGLRAIKRQVCIDTSGGQSLVVPRKQCDDRLPGRILDDQFTNSAVFSSENFVHFNAGLSYSLATGSDWLLNTGLGVQIADGHLITNEQFGAGGRSTVRGYFESEAIGDEGFYSTAEIAAPSLAPLLGKFVDELRGYAFVDAGYVRTLGVLPGVDNDTSLLSAGGGARLRLFGGIYGEVIVAVPLIDGTSSRSGTARTVFVVRGEF